MSMTSIERYAMRDARARESRINEARILLHEEISSYQARIAELEAELAELKKAETQQEAQPEEAMQPEAEKRPVEASQENPTTPTPKEDGAATGHPKGKNRGKK